ncbi:MAG: hypothetical protein GY796_25540 [Chloroflexi bacterium]|nr:hypothetical protein [Chloroflexota bacterium]
MKSFKIAPERSIKSKANKAWSGRARSGLFQVVGEPISSLSTRPPLKQTLGQVGLQKAGLGIFSVWFKFQVRPFHSENSVTLKSVFVFISGFAVWFWVSGNGRFAR